MMLKTRGTVKGFSQSLAGAKEESLPENSADALDLSKESGKKAQRH